MSKRKSEIVSSAKRSSSAFQPRTSHSSVSQILIDNPNNDNDYQDPDQIAEFF